MTMGYRKTEEDLFEPARRKARRRLAMVGLFLLALAAVFFALLLRALLVKP